jgi:hypothetical protein
MHSTYAYLHKHRYAPVRFLSLTNPLGNDPVPFPQYGSRDVRRVHWLFNGGGALLLAALPRGFDVYNAEKLPLHAVLPDNLSNNVHIASRAAAFYDCWVHRSPNKNILRPMN